MLLYEKHFSHRLYLVVALFLVGIQLAAISWYSVDVPFKDEWSIVCREALGASAIPLKWVFAQANEHRIATTKILYWVFYQINHLDFASFLVFSFLVFCLELALLFWFIAKNSEGLPSAMIAFLVMFLSSPLNWSNHTWSIMIHMHLYLIFLILSSHWLFSPEQRSRELFLAVLSIGLMIFSSAAGIPSSIALLGVYLVFKLQRFRAATDKGRQRGELKTAALVVAAVGVLIWCWFDGFVFPSWHPDFVLPNDRRFWLFLAELSALGFGFYQRWDWLSYLCLFLVLAPHLIELISSSRRTTGFSVPRIALVAGILAGLASIALGRAGIGDVAMISKEPRYFEPAAFLAVLAIVSWRRVFAENVRLREGFSYLLVFVCLITACSFYSAIPYIYRAQQKEEGLRCIAKNIGNAGEIHCPTVSRFEMSRDLAVARKLGLSFTRLSLQ